MASHADMEGCVLSAAGLTEAAAAADRRRLRVRTPGKAAEEVVAAEGAAEGS